MAYLKMPKDAKEVKGMTASEVRKSYNDIADTYKKMLDGDLIRCVDCGEWLSRSNFYVSKKYDVGIYPICKKCVLKRVQQINKKDDKPNETKESVIEMMRNMDLPYVDSLYDSCCQSVVDDVNERIKRSPFQQMLTAILSLPQYKGKNFKDSELPIDTESTNINKKIKKATIDRFGYMGFSDQDLLFLQNEYDSFAARCEINTIAQETLFERISCKKLEIAKATKAGRDTKDLDKALQDLMNSANILPKQNSLDTVSEGQTLGTLIEKWENERPIPECDPELADVDKIGQYIEVFFRGHMAKTVGLKNSLSNIYENFMRKFTIEKPEYKEDEDSEEIFEKIFGKVDGE